MIHMIRKLRKDEKRCIYCGSIFRTQKGTKNKKQYCDNCIKTGIANKETCKKWYYNHGWITKRNYETPSQINYKASLKNIHEQRINAGDVPLQFNQPDHPKKLGNTQLGERPVMNSDGEPDWEHEHNSIRKEIRRVNTNYTYNYY